MRTTSETSGTMLNTPHSNHRSTRRRWQKERWILKETIVENLPKIGNEIATQVQETQRLPNRINPRWNTPTHINHINEEQTQRANIKSSKEKATNNTQGIPIRIAADLSTETLQSRREWQDLPKVMEVKNLKPRLLYSKDLNQFWRKNQYLYRQAEVERI